MIRWGMHPIILYVSHGHIHSKMQTEWNSSKAIITFQVLISCITSLLHHNFSLNIGLKNSIRKEMNQINSSIPFGFGTYIYRHDRKTNRIRNFSNWQPEPSAMSSSICFLRWSKNLLLPAILIKTPQYELASMDYWMIVALTNLYITKRRLSIQC